MKTSDTRCFEAFEQLKDYIKIKDYCPNSYRMLLPEISAYDDIPIVNISDEICMKVNLYDLNYPKNLELLKVGQKYLFKGYIVTIKSIDWIHGIIISYLESR